jgi:CDP-glycerol glycerophosphotransferase (TagB/SpsB family)
MSNNPFFLFLRALKGFREFNILDHEDREIVFYSEDSASWVFFEPIIKELLNTHGKNICYLTSSADDPMLASQRKKIKSFYIGRGIVRTYLFLALKAKTMVMTMPDLETYQIKRSKAQKVHYVYVFHGMVSTTMIYRLYAFDHFDALLCVGPYQIKEIRANEELYQLKPKILVESGYGRLDSIIEEAQSHPQSARREGKKKILIAPTWGDNALLETCAFNLVDLLLENGHEVIYRPHPMTLRHRKKLLIKLQYKFLEHKNFTYETDVGSQESLHASDILVTDWSGTAIEYAFGLEKPVIFIDLPRKVNNPDYQKIHLEPFEVFIRSKIGIVIPPDRLKDALSHIEQLCSNSDSFKKEVRKLRSDNIFNIGTSGAIAADYIAKATHSYSYSLGD